MTGEELFEKLKRDGECWHEFLPYSNNPIEYPNSEKCLKCGKEFSTVLTVFGKLNPDFSTPDGFFWLWARAQEKDWWGKEFGRDTISVDFINPTRFTEALKRYLDE